MAASASGPLIMTDNFKHFAAGCFLLLRGESGTIKSSEFLEEHEHWEGSCQLVIHTSPDKRLSVLVEGMVIENDCGNAGLTVSMMLVGV